MLPVFLGQFTGEGDLAFDIGAHIGSRTDALLRTGATVIAIEPQPECAAFLREKYEATDRVVVIEKALADTEGAADLLISDESTLSTLSKAWVQATSESGRFKDAQWERTVKVSTTTLDKVIAEFGVPAFCKIDVEGAELPVLTGLSRSIGAVSFEFARESLDAAYACIARLEALGLNSFNLVLGAALRWELPEWTSADSVAALLASYTEDLLWGDVYASSRIALGQRELHWGRTLGERRLYSGGSA